jgi:nicotinamide riboside transporter PnuC
MPIPGNAEWLLWFIVEIVFAIIWAASNVTALEFMVVSAIITLGYLISRGIAKAGKVLEQ